MIAYHKTNRFKQILYICSYDEPQKKRRNFNNSIRYGKQCIYFFSLNYKFLLQHKVLVLITKSLATINYRCTRIYHYTYRQFHRINVRRIENCATFLLMFSIFFKGTANLEIRSYKPCVKHVSCALAKGGFKHVCYMCLYDPSYNYGSRKIKPFLNKPWFLRAIYPFPIVFSIWGTFCNFH